MPTKRSTFVIATGQVRGVIKADTFTGPKP